MAWPLPIVKLRSRSRSRSGEGQEGHIWTWAVPYFWFSTEHHQYNNNDIALDIKFIQNFSGFGIWDTALCDFNAETELFILYMFDNVVPSFFYIYWLRNWRDDRMLKLTVMEPDQLLDA